LAERAAAEKAGEAKIAEARKSQSDLMMSQSQHLLQKVTEAELNLARVEQSIRQFTGGISASGVTATLSVRPTVRQRMPEGPVVEKIKGILDAPAHIDFQDTPFAEIMYYFSDRYKVKFAMNGAELSNEGFDPTRVPITINLDVPLRSVLQALEDSYPKLQFVVRDYGILLTTRSDAERRGFVAAVGFGRKSAATYLGDSPSLGETPRLAPTYKGIEPTLPVPGFDPPRDPPSPKAPEPSNVPADPLGQPPARNLLPRDNVPTPVPAPRNEPRDDPFGN
jgi:hypothetical protein